MSDPSVVRSAALRCRADASWSVDECRVIAVLGESARIFVWLRCDDVAELRAYDEVRGQLREVSRQVVPSGAATTATDGRAACYVSGERIHVGTSLVAPISTSVGDAPSPDVVLGLEKNFCDLSWLGAEAAVGAAIAGSWPLGVLWRPSQGDLWTNLEPHPGLELSAHQPIVSICASQACVAIARSYGGVEVYFPTDNERTCTPTAIEYRSAARRGWLWASALSLSDDGSRVMMSGSEANRGFVLSGPVDAAGGRERRSAHERPYWLDREHGPRSDDPLLPDEGLLRVFPVQPPHIQAPSCEVQVDLGFTASDLNAQARTYAIAAAGRMIAGALYEDGSYSSAELHGRAQSVRLSNSGSLLAVASNRGLALFDLRT